MPCNFSLNPISWTVAEYFSSSPAESSIVVFSAVSDETLAGNGPGNSATNRMNTLYNMLFSAQDLIEAGDLVGACEQLMDAYNKCDGVPQPPDFVTGDAAQAWRL